MDESPDIRPTSTVGEYLAHQLEGAIKVTPTPDGEAIGSVMCRCGEGFYGKRPTIIEANEQALGALLAHIAETSTVLGEEPNAD